MVNGLRLSFLNGPRQPSLVEGGVSNDLDTGRVQLLTLLGAAN